MALLGAHVGAGGAIFAGCKWLTWRRASVVDAPWWRHASYHALTCLFVGLTLLFGFAALRP